MNDFERVYYQLNIRLASPLSVGSGESESTDHDVFVDGNGNPIIPATSLAGVLRAYIGGDTAVALFGDLAKTESEKSKSSNIRVYDARCTKGGKDYITNRDFVKLENKVAVKGAKFDCQVVETGAEFTAYCELLDCAFEPVLESALAALNKGEILLGSKTTRGFGRVKVSVKKRVFKNINTWLDFKMFNELAHKRFVYTRYADDIHISCQQKFDPEKMTKYIENVFREFGAPWILKPEKTHYGSRAGKNYMLGVCLNKDNNITTGWRSKRDFKAMTCNLIQDYKHGKPWPADEVQQYAGLLSYYKMVEKDYFESVIERFNEKFNVDVKTILKSIISC